MSSCFSEYDKESLSVIGGTSSDIIVQEQVQVHSIYTLGQHGLLSLLLFTEQVNSHPFFFLNVIFLNIRK